jgi:hypothetical protein
MHGAATTVAYQTTYRNAMEVFSSDPTDTKTLVTALNDAVAELSK